MFDDLFDEIDLGIRGSRRGQTIFRIFFGLLGLFLAIAGFLHVLRGETFAGAGLPFRLAAASVFVFLGFFCAINIALHKPWRWPGLGFVVSFVLLFVVRLAFGA